MTGPLRSVNVIGFVGVVVVNYLANSVPLNGQTTAEISGRYPVLFTPAGYVFAIWGLIYLLLAGFVIQQALCAVGGSPARVGALFAVSCVLNAGWIVSWHYESLFLSAIVMLGLLATLCVIYMRLRGQDMSGRERWLVRLPFSIYLAWISVATIANVAVVLYAQGWRGGIIGEVGWTVVMLAAATLVAVLTVRRNKDTAFAAVFIWAFIGMAVGQEPVAVKAAAWVASLMLAVVSVGTLGRFKAASARYG